MKFISIIINFNSFCKKIKKFFRMIQEHEIPHSYSFKLLPATEEHIEQTQEQREEKSQLVTDLRHIIGYEFKDPTILQQAFTHHSYEEGCSSLETLAYFGDTVLNFAIVREQHSLYPDFAPGILTRLRAANVDTEKLARVALKYQLHKFLRHNIYILGKQIEEFREAIEEYPLHSSGLVDAPKILADIVESLIAAVYFDSKNSFDTTWKIVKKLLEPIITPETLPIHPVTRLHEMCQRRKLKMKIRDRWEERGVIEVLIDGVCVGMAEFKHKRAIAKNRAAHHAYNNLIAFNHHLLEQGDL